MKLLFVSQWFPPEPAFVPLALAESMRENGHAVTVLTGLPNYPTGRLLDGYHPWSIGKDLQHGFDVVRVPLVPSHSSSSAGRILNYLSFAITSAVGLLVLRRGADGVVVYGSPVTSALGGIVSKYLTGGRYLVMVEDIWPESLLESGMVGGNLRSRILGTVAGWFSDGVYKGADRVVAISNGMKQQLERRGLKLDRIGVVMNWAPREFEAPLRQKGPLRHRLGLGDSATILLYSGNLGATHNLELWVRAVEDTRLNSTIHLVFMGGGVARPHLEEMRESLGLENVHFLDPVEETTYVTYLGDADALIVSLAERPGLSTAIPSKIPNALAAGKVILGSVQGDAASVICSAGGLVADSATVGGIADVIYQFTRMSEGDRWQREQLAIQYYQSKMSRALGIEAMEQQLISAFDQADPP